MTGDLPLGERNSGKGIILVTGGTGVLGKRIVSRLHQLGYSVRVISRKQRPGEITESIHSIRGDITDANVVEAAVPGCEAVFHCAAELKVENKMNEVNVVGTKNVHTAAQKNRIRFFCHLSSVGVIGRTNQDVVDENTPCNPMNVYEQTKLEAEHIVEKGIEGCSSVILRPTNVFAEETITLDSYQGIGRRARVWLTGRERSHLVYAADVVEAGIYLLENFSRTGCAKFIVSSDEELGGTNADVYAAVRRFLGRRAMKLRVTAPIELPYRLRRLRHGSANHGDVCYSARYLLSTGFAMPFGWLEGIKRVVEYNQEKGQQAGFDPRGGSRRKLGVLAG